MRLRITRFFAARSGSVRRGKARDPGAQRRGQTSRLHPRLSFACPRDRFQRQHAERAVSSRRAASRPCPLKNYLTSGKVQSPTYPSENRVRGWSRFSVFFAGRPRCRAMADHGTAHCWRAGRVFNSRDSPIQRPVVWTLLDTGLPVSELCGLTSKDVRYLIRAFST